MLVVMQYPLELSCVDEVRRQAPSCFFSFYPIFGFRCLPRWPLYPPLRLAKRPSRGHTERGSGCVRNLMYECMFACGMYFVFAKYLRLTHSSLTSWRDGGT